MQAIEVAPKGHGLCQALAFAGSWKGWECASQEPSSQGNGGHSGTGVGVCRL